MPTIPSNSIYDRSLPFISRSFISNSSPGFVGVTSLACNLFGHYKRQIFRSSASFPGRQPPPRPSLDTSTQSRNSRYPMTNYFDGVGSVFQSQNAWFAAGKYFHQTIRGFTCRILIIGVINFFCCNCCCLMSEFSNQFLIIFNVTPFVIRKIFVKLCINHSLIVPHQFDEPCCAINHPT